MATHPPILQESRANQVIVLALKALQQPVLLADEVARALLKIQQVHPDGHARARLHVEDARPWEAGVDAVELGAHDKGLGLRR